jgi:ActR/RegA family two-component response regulator
MAELISMLFVDDEDSIRKTLPLLLERQGFTVTCAGTVPEALSLIAQQKFQVLLTDLNIDHPGDGFAIVSAMRSTQPDALRFILTGYPAFDSALEAMRQQVDDYLVKPTDVETLVQSIKSKVGNRTPARLMRGNRLPDVIEEHLSSIIANFLKQAKADPDLSSVPMSDSERTDHIPRLLSAAMRLAAEEPITKEDRECSVIHGALRRKQGYTVPLLIRESRLVKFTVAGALQEHLLEIDISYLIRDMVTAFGTIDKLLEDSVRAFLRSPQGDAPQGDAPQRRPKKTTPQW